ncbi:nuclear transport factor 2 family protein [Sphingomonas cavernae]|uniref:Nuclear transport factor 2 family protein n=1 Tax=Sphingomonas cavernae TaxID=2320861 RepID=A0A418WPG7_9SPHN|nr:nuclear transport factor 2 family protein [Sphingomonas cavernae]RJF93125.1 nuclear transport factor 2 family protein [Sphingomonas cavernae]
MSLDLEAIERIKRVKYLYCEAIDRCDLALLETILTEDFSADYQGGSYRLQARGRAEFLAAIKAAFHPDFVGCHAVQHPIIDVHGDGTASGRWRLVDYAMSLRDDNLTTIGAATYVDDYALVDGAWKLRRSAYTRIYERVFNEPNPAITFHILGSLAR